MNDKCPTCDSPAPHLHPAVQHEGEVQICRDNFHLRVTPENTIEKIMERVAWLIEHSPDDPVKRMAEASMREVDALLDGTWSFKCRPYYPPSTVVQQRMHFGVVLTDVS